MAKVSDKVAQRLKQHVGSLKPKEVEHHFNKDEAKESVEDLTKDSAKLMRSEIDLSGIKDAIGSIGGKGKSIIHKVKAVAKKPADSKKPVAVIKKETTVVPPMHPKGMPYKDLMKDMDTGEAKDPHDPYKGRGLGFLGEAALDATELMGLKGLGSLLKGGAKGIMAKLAGRKTAKSAAGESEPAVDLMLDLKSKRNTPKVDLDSPAEDLNTFPKDLAEQAKNWAKPDEKMINARMKVGQGQYSRLARASDKPGVKSIRMKLNQLRDMRGY